MTQKEFAGKGLVGVRLPNGKIAWADTLDEALAYAEKVGKANGKDGKPYNQGMKTHEYVIKTALVMGSLHYFVGDVSTGKWVQTPPGKGFSSEEEARAYVEKVLAEANSKTAKLDNQGMNNENIDEIVNRFLHDCPKQAEKLRFAAVQYEKFRVKRRDAMKRYMECVDARQELDAAIVIAQNAVNKLKGEILRLQKERKIAHEEVLKAHAAYQEVA